MAAWLEKADGGIKWLIFRRTAPRLAVRLVRTEIEKLHEAVHTGTEC